MAYKILIDAGHGGEDLGAVYNGRQEKDDALRLALAVGDILESRGFDVIYSRTDDRYDTPFEKAMKGNMANADLFLSIHRNAMPIPGTANGIETLVYTDQGVPARLARNINAALESAGFTDLGVIERPNLVVLRRTRMPSVLVEVGFIDSDKDNALFDANFEKIAQAIANGVSDTVEARQDYPSNDNPNYPDYADEMIQANNRPPLYRVQVGAFRNRSYAQRLLYTLLWKQYPAFITYNDGLYRVQVGAFRILDNAVKMEQKLRADGFDTFITRY